MTARDTAAERLQFALAILVALLTGSCQHAPPANPHYVLGAPYQAGDAWFYPRESYQKQETGLATVYPPGHAELTADGEAFDQTALAAAHQTLQLPAIGRLTNLENGRQVVVRINDRGPATPHRIMEITRRTAALLGMPNDSVMRVRLEILPAGKSRGGRSRAGQTEAGHRDGAARRRAADRLAATRQRRADRRGWPCASAISTCGGYGSQRRTCGCPRR